MLRSATDIPDCTSRYYLHVILIQIKLKFLGYRMGKLKTYINVLKHLNFVIAIKYLKTNKQDYDTCHSTITTEKKMLIF